MLPDLGLTNEIVCAMKFRQLRRNDYRTHTKNEQQAINLSKKFQNFSGKWQPH
jgi:hypothetical protein